MSNEKSDQTENQTENSSADSSNEQGTQATKTGGDVHSAVRKLVEGSSQEVFDGVANEMAQEEISDRKKVLRSAIIKKGELDKQIGKLVKPDVEGTWSYDPTTQKSVQTAGTFTKAAIDNLKKVTEERDALIKATNAAINNGSRDVWAKLKEKVGKAA